jgi:hypothetical protein
MHASFSSLTVNYSPIVTSQKLLRKVPFDVGNGLASLAVAHPLRLAHCWTRYPPSMYHGSLPFSIQPTLCPARITVINQLGG